MAKKKKPLRSKRTGKFVSASYAKRYPHLVKGGKKQPARALPAVPRAVVPAAKKRAVGRPVATVPVLPVGTELELTATTKGGTPRRDKRGGRVFDPAVLAVKVYATLRAPMTFQDAARAVQRAVLAGVWNRRDLGIEYMDWSKGRREGYYTNQTREKVDDALVSFRRALQGAAVRVAVVDQ